MTLLSPSEVERAWKMFKEQKNPSARESLILHYSYLVHITANRIISALPSHLEWDDLLSAGVMGLIKAVDQFDPSRKVKFETYAIALIRGAILEMLRVQDWVPRSIRDRQKRLEKAYLDLERQLGRPATEQEVAQELGISLDELQKQLAQTAKASVLSLDELLLGGEGHETGVTLGETIADLQADTYTLVEGSERHRLLCEAIDRLPPREKLVMQLYYADDLTFREIGQVLNISESRAYQLHSQAIKRLRGYLQEYEHLFTGKPLDETE